MSDARGADARGADARGADARGAGARGAGARGAGARGDTQVPRWDLSEIYGGFDAPDYASDRARLRAAAVELGSIAADTARREEAPASWLRESIERINEVSDLEENLSSYAYAVYSCDTAASRALREINGIEADTLPTAAARVHFRNALRELGSLLYTLMEGDEKLSAYRFFLEEELENQQHQMTASEEALAADLGRSGADAWSRLQDSVSSTLSVLWDEETGETKTVVELRSLAHDPDRSIRRHAWQRELDAWKQMETPLAFAINGVKGHTISLNERRGYRDPLDKATSDSRISRTTLDTLIGVAEESLPVFRRYLHAKAELLGLERAAFYDLFAPIGIQSGQWTFAEARRTIETVFGSFSDKLAAFARNAFDKRWIDALPRKGKVGGAYCASMPNARVSRVLANYDSTFSSVSTLAHELGHAYHHEVLKEHPASLRDYPMTLAETASIFSETLMFNHALNSTSGMEKLVILDTFLQDTTQVVVDILSRFYFEQSLFAARQEGELSPEELNSLMTDAQKRAYGDGLDETQLHPYMWAAKVHYYIPSLSFYNFPYTFGALFAMALFGLYESDTAGFPARYNELLEMTGSASAEQVTAGLGFDIQKPTFWRQGISVIERHVREFETLVAGK